MSVVCAGANYCVALRMCGCTSLLLICVRMCWPTGRVPMAQTWVMPDNSRLAPTDRRGPTLRRGTRDTGMGAGMTKSVSYFGTHAGKSPVKAVASAAMALAVLPSAGSCRRDCSFCCAGCMRGKCAWCLGPLWPACWAAAGLDVSNSNERNDNRPASSRLWLSSMLEPLHESST